MPTGLRPVVPTIGASLVAGCSFVTTTIRDRTDAIGGTSAAIAANTAVVQTSTGGACDLSRRATGDSQRWPGGRAAVIAPRGL